MALNIPIAVTDPRHLAGVAHCRGLFNEANKTPIVDGEGQAVLDADEQPTYEPGLTDEEYTLFIMGTVFEDWARQKEEADFQAQVQALRQSQGL